MIALESNQKITRCYICGRTEKEFLALLNPAIYGKKISELEAEIAPYLKNLSTEIKAIVTKTEGYDGSISIADLIDNERIYSKFMPDWELLLKYLTERVQHDRAWGISTKYSCYDEWRPYTIAQMRKILSNASAKLDNGEDPGVYHMIDDHILEKEKNLRVLKMKKEELQNIIANMGFKAYEIILREIKDDDKKIDEKITVQFKLCPICSDLHAKLHESIRVNAPADDSDE